MRGIWSTLALLLVALGLGGYIYYGGVKDSSDTPKLEKVFPGLDSATVSDLTVKSESGSVTTLKKDGMDWKEVTPDTLPAAGADVSAIATALSEIEVARVVDEKPTDVKEYGLDPARIEISYKTADGKSSGKLLVGAKTSTGGNLYVRRDDQTRVVLIPQYHDTTFNKTAFDLRDKAIVKFDRSKIDGVDMIVDGKSAEIGKTDGTWRINKPIAARADFSAVEGLAGKMESLQMKSVLPAALAAPDLKQYGLDKPSATINLHLGSARVSMLVGAKVGDVTYVREASKPDIYTVEPAAADDLKKPLDDYRRKELFDFRAFDATRVEITRGGKTLTLERVKSKEEGKADSWHRVTPTPSDPDSSAVQNFLAGLADIRSTSFVDAKTKTGLDAPAMTVVAKFEEGKREEHVTFGKVGAEVFASRPDDPGASKVDADKFDEAVKAFDEISK